MERSIGERRVVAVLMADVASSTAIGAQLGPERSKFLFDDVVGLMADEVRRFGGTVAQLVGDGLFALYGLPTAHEDDSERAVRAALAIQEGLAKFATEVEEAYGVSLAARIGINTGPVLVPPPGTSDAERYNALGDTVNVAARLQAVAGEGGVAVGAATARQVEQRFDLEPLGETELKGKDAPLTVFRVTGERALPTAPPRASPLVGREADFAVLREAFATLAEGRGVILAVIGEAGIGKSRLVSEACAQAEGIRFLEGHAVAYAETIPYWPVRQLLRSWLGLGVSDPEARLRLELKPTLASLLGDRADETYPFLANLVGLSEDRDVAGRLREFSRDSVQRQTRDAVGDVLRALSRRQPVCLVLDDLHWADNATLTLLEDLLALTEEEALGFALLFRSDPDHASWTLAEYARRRFRHRFRELELGPLEPEDALKLAGGELPEPVAQLLLERSGGNPFFVEEALRDLVERGTVRRINGRFELTNGLAQLDVPNVVQEALQARLERLAPETRDVVVAAAVIGQSFGTPLLERVCSESEVTVALSELQRLELVVEERRRPTPEYRFRHGLVREAAYASLTSARRQALHRSVGESLEELFGRDRTEAYGQLARHFAEGDEPAKAADYLLRAGDEARALYADDEALEHYRRSLGFLDQLGDEARAHQTLLKVALTHHMAFDFERAAQSYREAFSRHGEQPRRLKPAERIAIGISRPESAVPGFANSTYAWFMARQIYRGLLTVDRELNVVPDLAESFEISSDGLRYRFQLRREPCWSDGVPVTAEDFAWAWLRMREQEVPSAFHLEPIQAAEALDDRTLDVRLREPRNYFLYLLAQAPYYPWPRHVGEQRADDWHRPEQLVTNGPFLLTQLDDDQALITASPRWTGARGNVAEAHVTFTTRSGVVEAWRAGRLDVAPVARMPEDAPNTIAEVIPGTDTWYVGFRADVSPFVDARVRRAFSHALDRARIAAVAGSDEPSLRGGFIPPAMPGHSHDIALDYNLGLARRLLAEAGHPGGRGLPELSFAVIDDPHLLGVARELVEQWQELGARVTVEGVPFVAMEAAVKGRSHLCLWGWAADYPDPDGMLRTFLEYSTFVYRDADILGLLARARSGRDQDERLRLYTQAERLLISEYAAIVPLPYTRWKNLRRPWIDGFSGAADFALPGLEQIVVRREAR